jgi:pyridoxal 5'-phosphate synthase pdxT subunit
MKIGVLALQGSYREHREVLDALGADAVEVRTPEVIDALDAVILPGGESTTMSKLLDTSGVRAPLQARLADGLPVLGTCAGMILLAREVLDGRPDQQSFAGIEMTVRRNAFGRQVDSFEAPVPIDGVDGPPFHAVFIRAPWVERVGPDVEVLGTVADGPAAGRIVAVRQGQLLATAFHPELTGDLRVHQLFVELVRSRAATAQTTEG